MPCKSDFRRHFERFGICSVAILALVLLAPPCGRADTWTVTIDVSSEKDVPTYSVVKTGTVCTLPTPSDAYFLNICVGDVVVWKAATKSGSYQLKVFFRRFVLDDAAGKPTRFFSGDQANLTQGGQTDKSIPDDAHDEYEYSVSVFDTVNKKLFVHDPKIMVGTGGSLVLGDLVNALERNADQLSKSLQTDTNAEVKEDLEKLRKIIRSLKERLHQQQKL